MAMLVNPDRSVITVWSDIGCPWATLALHTLRQAIAEAGKEIWIDHRVFPLELFNRRGTPKPIIDAEVIAIGGLVESVGLKPWSAPDWTYTVTTLPAMEAVQAAKEASVGGLPASDELDAALRRAFYSEHICISTVPAILDVAAGCPSLDVDALRHAVFHGSARSAIFDQWQVAQTDDVVCSPHIFAPSGFNEANPGARYRWTGGPETGIPRLDSYDPGWATTLVRQMIDGGGIR